jgi:hypothetical protein
MKKTVLSAVALLIFMSPIALAKEARLVRYPHYHNGAMFGPQTKPVRTFNG